MGRPRAKKKVGYSETWDGGYVRYDVRGRKVFVIRRLVGDKRYDVSTRCHTEEAARAHLEAFEANPGGYSPEAFAKAQEPAQGPSSGGPVFLAVVDDIEGDQTLTGQFLRWSRDVKHNTHKWVGEQRLYLSWWAGELDGVDLRKATLGDHILPALEGAKARAPKIAVIKRFYSWARKERHLISRTEDPTLDMLTVPQSNPKNRRIKDKAFPKEHYLLAREHLTGHWRDSLDVLAGTGWHTTELKRFAEAGNVERLPKGVVDEGAAGVLVCPQTKAGNPFRTAVGPEVLEAGKRLRARGSVDLFKLADAIKAACAAAEIQPAFTPGRFRHAVATWAVNAGADPAQVAAFLNHRSPTTTRKFYASFAVPARVPTLA